MAEYHGDLSQFEHVRFKGESDKSLVIAYLLWFFIGGTGAHWFYLDDIRAGMIRMLLLLALCLCIFVSIKVFFVLWIIIMLLWVADAVMIALFAR